MLNSKDNVLNYLFTVLNNFSNIEKYPNLTTLLKQITLIFHEIENDFIDLKKQDLKINEIDDITNYQFFKILTHNLQISNINLNLMNHHIIEINQISQKILTILNSTKTTNLSIKYDVFTTNLDLGFYLKVNNLNLIGILKTIFELITVNECLFISSNSNDYFNQFQLFQKYLTNIQNNLIIIIKSLTIINAYYHQILKDFKIPATKPNRFQN
ncbi:hypothetical protein ATP_00417 [Candidatus Phytoplasma mali]|uniref:Uncharacterized protein n=1 Tax=Phytoplasma mali (strain AT) TaxID=482235 RepID=B3QZJ7_PHYMT|nr:hypothetical protein [Candidatus Phytoplasma mali]CAP18604.1 hypothetical protein ATP_00417 [Candidatus Phytoplasma mali]